MAARQIDHLQNVHSRRVEKFDPSCRSACLRLRLYGIVARGLATSEASNNSATALFDTSSVAPASTCGGGMAGAYQPRHEVFAGAHGIRSNPDMGAAWAVAGGWAIEF